MPPTFESGTNPDVDLAPFIDHTLLSATATPDQVRAWCEQADRYRFAAVCVFPSYVRLCAELLNQKRPKVCTVIGFPSGASTSAVKLYEAQEAVENGATELDVVINLSWLKQGQTDAVHRELASICEATGQTVKAILETNLLEPEEKRVAAEICLDAGVAFLKTNTGWAGGATVEDVRLLREVTRGRIGIKASGGIKTAEQALALIGAGATRLGTSRSLELLNQREALSRSASARALSEEPS
ncbi:deoxyribose-phosphate aldolase [Leptolyngbya sp. FACHB-261]|uniref:deoxyribose-phosphate aldolase n=1 Tax=Leptolyngbya sp. FACHB-261 TaxID=2692806 RepID=UPI0016892C96|nr:deoxyribose-phosphate aldolase [Leptolyngbya sp. FACHB-261]MBD2101191.1 deoxyribose-phosphate aldolase [Leptolyngbya sp. FACHB-261]